MYRYIIFLSLTLNTWTQAAITTGGDFMNGSPAPTLTLTNALTFFIESTGSVRGIAFDEWVTSDGGSTTALAVVVPSIQLMSYQINGGSIQTIPVNSVIDNAATTLGDMTANDGYLFFFAGISVNSGDAISFSPGIFTFSNASGFNANIPATFNGDAYTINQSGLRLSSLSPVPEPATGLFGLIAVGMLACFRKRTCAP